MFYPEDLLKIFLAILVGGLIGAEREYHNKAAGFRTLIFICLGATLFTILSIRISADRSDPARLAAQIVTGVGFIGAGVIMRDAGRIQGITTAATIWLIAALGTGLGMGQYALVGAATASVLVVLWLFPVVEHRIDNLREERLYEITCPATLENADRITLLLKTSGLQYRELNQHKTGPDLHLSGQLSGSADKHERLVHQLLADPEVKNFRF
jgi:putative Mg2+ transporter-C (MgtC) family protein